MISIAMKESKKQRKTKRKRKPYSTSKAGMPPGMFIFTGDQKMEKTAIELLVYDEKDALQFSLDNIEEAFKIIKDTSQTAWLNIIGLHETEVIEKIIKEYDLHKLSGEDILNVGQRPKLDDYQHYIHIVVKTLQIDDTNIIDEQVSIIFMNNLLITFQEKHNPTFDFIRNRLIENKGQIRSRQTDYLAYSLLDSIVDYYFIMLDQFESIIEDLETTILKKPSENLPLKLNDLKRDASFIRRSIFPMREVANQFGKLEHPYIYQETKLFIRDLFDHITQVIETISSFKESLNSLLDLYMSSVSYHTSNVMKVLTIVSTIFIPLTFIVGVYGMNFINMPELTYKYGYLLTMIGMAILTLLMIIYLKRKKWL